MGKSEERGSIQSRLAQFYEKNPFVNKIFIEIIQDDGGEVHLELSVREEHTNPHGIAHGGVLLSIADTAMGAACLLRNKHVVTVSLSMTFFRPAPIGARIYSKATVLHDGRSMMSGEAELYDENRKLLAKAQASFFVIGTLLGE